MGRGAQQPCANGAVQAVATLRFQTVREHLFLPQIGALLGPKTVADLAKPEKKKKEPKVLPPAANTAQV